MIRRGWLVVLMALSGSALSCGPAIVSLKTGTRTYTPDAYEDVYDKWTREVEEFDWGALTSVVYATATFESWDFRWSYVSRYAHDYAIGEEMRDEMLRATLEDTRQSHRFFVTVASKYFRESDLTDRGTAWRVVLVDDEGNDVKPVEIEYVRRPTAAEKVYFPTTTSMRKAFRVVFPTTRPDGTQTIPKDARFVILRLTGARGRIDLRWEFQEGLIRGESES